MKANSSVSLPTAPSVMKTTCRTVPGAAASSSAAASAGRISVPPSALERVDPVARQLDVRRVGRDAVAGRAAAGTQLNSMTLKRSSGRSWSSARCSASLACLIDWPAIEPEVSRMKTVSRGCAPRVCRGRAASPSAARRCRRRSPSANSVACGSAPVGRRPDQHEVAVGRDRLVGQRDQLDEAPTAPSVMACVGL